MLCTQNIRQLQYQRKWITDLVRGFDPQFMITLQSQLISKVPNIHYQTNNELCFWKNRNFLTTLTICITQISSVTKSWTLNRQALLTINPSNIIWKKSLLLLMLEQHLHIINRFDLVRTLFHDHSWTTRYALFALLISTILVIISVLSDWLRISSIYYVQFSFFLLKSVHFPHGYLYSMVFSPSMRCTVPIL